MFRYLRHSIYLTLVILISFYGSLFWSFNYEAPQWKTEQPTTAKRVEAASALVGDKLYLLFGFDNYEEHNHKLIGSNHVSVLDTNRMQWTRLPDSPFRGTHVAAATDGALIYLVGGFEGDHPGPAVDNFLIYNTEDSSWTSGPPIPLKLGGGTLVRLGRMLHYVSGFYTPLPEPSNEKHWALNLDNFSEGWSPRAPIPVARGHAGFTGLNGKLYIIGGVYTHDPMHDESDLVHRYDPQTDSWEEVAPLPWKLSHTEPGTFVHKGKILVAGGRNGATETLSELQSRDIISYDPKQNRWSQAGVLPTRLRSPAMRIVNNKVIVSTGSTYWGMKPTDRTWSMSCENNPICGEKEHSSLKLRIRSFHKRLALILPYKIQQILQVKKVANLS